MGEIVIKEEHKNVLAKAKAYDKMKEIIVKLYNSKNDHAVDCERIGCRCGCCPCTCYLDPLWDLNEIIKNLEDESSK